MSWKTQGMPPPCIEPVGVFHLLHVAGFPSQIPSCCLMDMIFILENLHSSWDNMWREATFEAR